ncbi:MAG TPA: M20/M25/M40 family metallo-hydrolase [Caldilineae bacterium]|nr:M20/M25/M40 family metallo-hydrolase [Caldilineae bacterium]
MAFAEIETLTGPPYLGRLAGSAQGRAAGDYIAARFAAYGLRPAGEDGGFFQLFTLTLNTLSAEPTLRVTAPNGESRDYDFRSDFSPVIRHFTGGGEAEGEVVWVQDCAHDDFDAVDAVGKIVFCRSGAEEEQGRQAVEHGAAGLLLLVEPEQYPLDRIGPYRTSWLPLPIPALRIAPTVATGPHAGSGLTLDDLSIHYESIPLATSASIAIPVSVDENATGRNVLGVLPGRDPAYADEIVILGGHYDHLGQDPDGTAWVGANDNASGVATLLEIARIWEEQGYVPRRTVLFAAWDAEEQGLLGSIHYVENPIYPLDNTVAMLQLDSVAGGGGFYLEAQGDRTAEATLRFAMDRAAELTESRLTLVDPDGRSDQISFREAGIPSLLLIWKGANEDNRPDEISDEIEPYRLGMTGRAVSLALMMLAEGRLP